MLSDQFVVGGTKLVPPFRFATVEVGVYRGAYPTLKVPPALRRPLSL